MNGTTAFWIDDAYDRDQASDGVSRFGAYVRQSRSIAGCWDGARYNVSARFAAAAWETATPPVMSPGYVRRHPRVLRARVDVSPWNATLVGSVELVMPWPDPLASAGGWQGSTCWRDWPAESLGRRDAYREPDDDELAAHAYLMASARLHFPLDPLLPGLPSVPSSPRFCVEHARMAIEALVIAMNAAVAPVIGALEGRP